jgi:hypothetical protein
MINRSKKFKDIYADIGIISLNLHESALLRNATANKKYIEHSLRDITKSLSSCAIVISAGPSIHKKNSIKKIRDSKFNGVIIAVDGSYISCIKEGLIPDYLLTLDPHPSRIVRWFGDPDFELNSVNDDYFSRQDLDVSFRNNASEENSLNIKLIDQYAKHSDLVICSSSPENVVSRVHEAGFKKVFWWNPLVDDPNLPESLTKKLFSINGLPCMNTGGNVGTAACVFASTILGIKRVAMVGMDFGYYLDLPYSQTQKYYELLERLGGDLSNLESHFPKGVYPQTGETFYTDATYLWYKNNFTDLLQFSTSKFYNCTEGGMLYGKGIDCIPLQKFLKD